jgi:hypothetical protein
MASRATFITRLIGPGLPLTTIAASYFTLLALGFSKTIAATLPFVPWFNVALIIEFAVGALLFFSDIFRPTWRTQLSVCSVALLILAAIFGWSAAYSLVSYP